MLRFVIIFLLILGIFFRFFHLDRKVYWFDEVYTSFRVAGYTSQEIDREIFQNQLITPADLQKFQQIKPESTLADTIESLITEDPQHPPLYFSLARGWMQMFGSSLTASRSLPALISLLSLPLMYALAKELFITKSTPGIATALLALSPFDILFAQTARQYSLLTLTILGSSYFLIKAVKNSIWRNWILFILFCSLGLYTHPFFCLNLAAYIIFICFYYTTLKNRNYKILVRFSLSIFSCLIIYSPWLNVLKNNSARAFQATNWANETTNIFFLIKQWILSFSALFFDLDWSSDNILNYLLRLPFIILIILSIHTSVKQTNHLTKIFLLSLIFVPFLLLAIPDLLFASKRSSVTRYLISCFPGIQLAVAYFLTSTKITFYQQQKLWRLGFAFLFTCSIISCSISAWANTWWCKGISYYNAAIAQIINQSQSAIIISDRGDGSLIKGNLISLSYILNDNIRILPLSSPPNLKIINKLESQTKSDLFLFAPSKQFWQESKSLINEQSMSSPSNNLIVHIDQTLWQIKTID